MKAGDFFTYYSVKHLVVRKIFCLSLLSYLLHDYTSSAPMMFFSQIKIDNVSRWFISQSRTGKSSLLHIVYSLYHFLLQREMAIHAKIHLPGITSFKTVRIRCTLRSQASGKSRPYRSSHPSSPPASSPSFPLLLLLFLLRQPLHHFLPLIHPPPPAPTSLTTNISIPQPNPPLPPQTLVQRSHPRRHPGIVRQAHPTAPSSARKTMVLRPLPVLP